VNTNKPVNEQTTFHISLGSTDLQPWPLMRLRGSCFLSRSLEHVYWLCMSSNDHAAAIASIRARCTARANRYALAQRRSNVHLLRPDSTARSCLDSQDSRHFTVDSRSPVTCHCFKARCLKIARRFSFVNPTVVFISETSRSGHYGHYYVILWMLLE